MCADQTAPRAIRGGHIRRSVSIRYIGYAALLLLSFFVLSPLVSRPQSAPRFISKLFDATDSATVSAITSVATEESLGPSIGDVLPEEHTGVNPYHDRTVAQGEDGRWRFGTFVINNPGSSGFVLQVMFTNGGVLKHKSGASIKLERLSLIYRNVDEGKEIRVIDLDGVNYNGDGYVYEVSFRLEDYNVQDRYEMELWGALSAESFGKARAGPYSETVKFAIEVNF